MSRAKKVSFNWAELMPKIEAVPLASLNPYKNNPRMLCFGTTARRIS